MVRTSHINQFARAAWKLKAHGSASGERTPARNRNTLSPSLWSLLKAGVCKSARDKRKRIAVQDSKKLYTPAAGLTNLERGVLTFASLADHHPTCIEELLEALGHDDHSRVPDTLWYQSCDSTENGSARPSPSTELIQPMGRGTIRLLKGFLAKPWPSFGSKYTAGPLVRGCQPVLAVSQVSAVSA